ncbi:methylmalonyl-CoA mutase [Polaromonas jejuensis]|uniref:Methylmalonyl-CoA mutase n=1 Tax=Polaromonas jejuensis TaxID=457502 RepID=A0ABW0Q9V6_9BURK
MLKRLQQAVIENHNVFEVLMAAVRVCSLGQITHALFGVGGQYRRNMWEMREGWQCGFQVRSTLSF